MVKKNEEQTETTTDVTAESSLPHGGDHDRVTMLSRRADGTPDQHNPEIIGDKEGVLEASKEQLRQQAVSAVDVAERGVSTDTGTTDGEGQDPTVQELTEKHQAAEKDAEARAEAEVEALHKGVGDGTV